MNDAETTIYAITIFAAVAASIIAQILGDNDTPEGRA